MSLPDTDLPAGAPVLVDRPGGPAPARPDLPRTDLPRPDRSSSTVIVPAPGNGPGHWAGAPTAVADGDGFWLAYRLRRPVREGRGVAVELARWEGGRLDVVARLQREALEAESLERPALVRRADGGWRLYVSCATYGSKHWWVEAFDAAEIEGLSDGERTVVFPGSATVAVKDPVVRRDDDGWHAWVCCHPLDVPGAEDRMWTGYTRSDDGLVWDDVVPVLEPGEGWEARGRRVTTVLRTPDAMVAYYDARASAEENWFERTGIAVATGTDPGARLDAVLDGPLAQAPDGTGALRYLCAVAVADGYRLFYEVSRADGAHDLVTQHWVRPAGSPRGRPAS